jgi:hypothetical protein
LLVDSGSTYTIVDIGLYNDLPEAIKPTLEDINLVLRSANGQTLEVHGQSNMPIEIGENTYYMPVKVVSLGNKATILGLDFMSDNNCVLYMGNGVMQIGSSQVNLQWQGDNRCARIQVAETMFIPPHHEMVIPGSLQGNRWFSHKTDGLVEPVSSLSSKTGLLMAKSVINTEKPILPLRVVNCGSETIELKKGATVALLHPVKNITNFSTQSDKTTREKTTTSEVPEHLKSLIDEASEDLTT